jgi:hypothetical protein
MNSEFHYYALYFACVRAGLPEERAGRIAYSSQYVDEAINAFSIDGGSYLTEVTQNYAFWDESVLRDIYLPFHFVPAAGACATGARWATAADCPIAKELLVAALNSRDDYRIGIALHAYADGWAHQNFSGRLEEANAVDPSSPLPPVGHLQALRRPDDPAGEWLDPRLGPGSDLVANRERFMKAARKIYRFLRASQRLGFEDEELALEPLGRIWESGPRDARSRIVDYTVELGVPPYDKAEWLELAGLPSELAEDGLLVGYDKLAWLRSELRERAGLGQGVRSLDSGGRFGGSSLHRWNEAARAHRGAAKAIFAREGFA